MLLIELVDGSVIKRDISDEPEIKKLPIGTPANSPTFAGICQAIACGGFSSQDTDIGPKKYKHIAPSQIKTVSVEFTSNLSIGK